MHHPFSTLTRPGPQIVQSRTGVNLGGNKAHVYQLHNQLLHARRAVSVNDFHAANRDQYLARFKQAVQSRLGSCDAYRTLLGEDINLKPQKYKL